MAPCASGCSAGSCRRCGSAAPSSTGSSMTRPCSRAAGTRSGSPSSIPVWSADGQLPVSLSLATGAASMPVACELYLPEEWAHDRKRRLHAGVPPHLVFRTKIEMAIDQIRHAATGLPRGIVLADAAYGGARSFRDALRDLDLAYALGIESNTTAVPAAGAAGPPPARARAPQGPAGPGPGGVPGPARGPRGRGPRFRRG